jgi:MFS transporter, YQGE family, putative transporter
MSNSILFGEKLKSPVQFNNAAKLIFIGGLFILANGLSSVFVTVFLWKLSHDYVRVALYNISIYAFMPVGFLICGWLSRRTGILNCLRTGMILLVVYFSFILYLKITSVSYIYLLGVLYGIGYGFFYYSSNTLTYYYSTESNRGFILGLSNSFMAVMNILAPTISGWIIINGHELIGYYQVFFITLLLYVVAGAVSFSLKNKIQSGSFSLKRIMLTSGDSNWSYIMKGNFFLGIREGAIYFIIDILYFITFKDELSLGGFTTIISFIGVVSSFLIGKYIANGNVKGAILIGGIITFMATLVLVLNTSVVTVILYGILTNIFNYLWLIPVALIQYHVAQRATMNEEAIGDYMIAKELPLALGRILGIFIFILIENSVFKSLSVKISLPILNLMVLVAFLVTFRKIAMK